MSRNNAWQMWGLVVLRSLLIGGLSGLFGGALIFFLFGFIGFAGATLPIRLANGLAAAIDPGVGKGLIVGLAIAGGLAATVLLWTFVGGRLHPYRTRAWLSTLAILSVVASNLESLRTPFGWDGVGIATVFGMGLLAASIVWAVAPWVLKIEIPPSRDGVPTTDSRGLRQG